MVDGLTLKRFSATFEVGEEARDEPGVSGGVRVGDGVMTLVE